MGGGGEGVSLRNYNKFVMVLYLFPLVKNYVLIHSLLTLLLFHSFGVVIIEIINNTRGGIVIFFIENKRERVF